MMEWSKLAQYNSFNSWKGLTYFEHYKQTVGWLEGKNPLPPPIECNLDPFAECNLDCYFCITQRYLKHNRTEAGEMRKLPTEYMHSLVEFLAQWGVRGLCLSGGGDPSLHEGVPEIIAHAHKIGMKVAMFTNVVRISEELIDEAMKCQWITFSVDASNRDRYSMIKGKDKFDTVIANIHRLVEARSHFKSEVLLTWCSLVLPENQYTLYRQCLKAKEVGVQVFRVRPVDFERPDIEGYKPLPIDVPEVMEQFARCHAEATPEFQVYTTTHKFDANFHNVQLFSKCLATPLLLTVLSDGNSYLCVDHKMKRQYKLGSAYPNPETILEWWGSDAHRRMIKGIIPANDCANQRCTFGIYNQQIEGIVLNDNMCLSFP